ncbi:aspartate/glutamate racemase family protein [Formosa sp. 4Alg 33]|uniref:aspartate/glutamate racemase family protein n=1 Tax=Formosa sp. 4Alg 33 TaxID=3382189 RepID=UPI003D9C1C19
MVSNNLVLLGLGSRTTTYYLGELNAVYNKKNGDYSTCPLLVYNVDFNDVNSLLPNTSETLDGLVQGYLKDIISFKADAIIIPNITLHETVDRLHMDSEILHPLHLTVNKLKQHNCDKIVLFGSLYSMTADYIRSYFKANIIEVVLPSENDMAFIDTVRKEVYNGTETSNLVKQFHECIARYAAIHPVVLGCTELSVLNPKYTANIIDMAQLQIDSAIDRLS